MNKKTESELKSMAERIAKVVFKMQSDDIADRGKGVIFAALSTAYRQGCEAGKLTAFTAVKSVHPSCVTSTGEPGEDEYIDGFEHAKVGCQNAVGLAFARLLK